MIERCRLEPATVADVGCGAGGVLAAMRQGLPKARLSGFDIAPDATQFWAAHSSANIEFKLGNFLEIGAEHYDLLLALDVVEHLPNPFDFLSRLRGRASHYVFHFPLDLSAASVLREAPLLHARRKVGHLHYYTRGLALELLADCGYRVIEARYTSAGLEAPQRSWSTRLARLPRRIAHAIGGDWGVRLLGGETLLVLAQTDARP